MDDYVLTDLSIDIIRRIIELLSIELTDSLPSLIYVSQLRTVSKLFSRLIDDDYVHKNFMRAIIRKFSKNYLPRKLEEIFNNRDTNAFQVIFRAVKAADKHHALKVYDQYFWRALHEADVPFMQVYLSSTADLLSYRNIMQAVEIANERDDRCAMMLLILPYLVSFIPSDNVDPVHIDMIKLSLMSGIKLTIEPEFKNELTDLLRNRNDKRLDSGLLMKFLEPKKQKIIVPKGRVLAPTKVTDLFVNYNVDYSKGKPKYATTNFVLPLDSWTIKYVTASNEEKTITFAKNKDIYQYEGLKTSNLYELFVRTSIFSQILETFPHQHVAFTEETMKRPFEEQPWFFGALTDEEVEQITSNAAGQTTILMRSVGSNVYMHFSKKGSRDVTNPIKPHRFNFDQNFWQEFNSAALKKYKFHTGFYNGGYVKDLPMFQFFKAIDRGDFAEIQKVFNTNRIDAAHPSFRHQNVLLGYLIKNKVANEKTIQWMVEKRFPLNIDFRMLERLLKNIGVTVKTIEIVWPLLTEPIDGAALVASYLKIVDEHWASSDSKAHRDYFTSEYTRQTLIHLAWRYGNDDNYFKMLPGEIIEMLCQFNLDPVPWEEIAEFLLQKTTNQVDVDSFNLPLDMQIDFGRLYCDNFTKFTSESHMKCLRSFIRAFPATTSPLMFKAFKLLKRYVLQLKPYIIRTARYVDQLADLFHLCLTTASQGTETNKYIMFKKNTAALELLKVLLDIEPLREFHMTKCSFTDYVRTDRLPCYWRAIKHKNSGAVEYLVSHNWMPLTHPSTTKLSATEYARDCRHNDIVKLLTKDSSNNI